MTNLDSIFKAYDIRGIVPDELDATIARGIGAAFARFTDASRILVGRDMRLSGVELSAAFADGVIATGADVVDLGLISTDLAYFAAGELNAPAAMFTASHNPAAYNGVKLCLAGARPVGQDTGLVEIKAMVAAGAANAPNDGRHWGEVSSIDLLSRYGDHVRSFIDRAGLRPLRIVADTGNGMGGLVLPEVFHDLPFEVEILFATLDGSFPNHPPNPIEPENLKDLQARILEVGADVGLAFDGDADRMFLVDDAAKPLSGSTTAAMVASAILAKNPGSTVLYNLICSKAVPEIIRERGGVPVRTRVGHSFIKATMAETGAVLGAEHSGHYYFRDNYRADSGLIAAMVVLEELCRETRPLSELRHDYERYAASGEINVKVADALDVIERVAAAYAAPEFAAATQDRLDGLTVDLGSWWFNLRPSNTEPLLRVNLEAADERECQAHLAEILDLVKES